jgi:hypothetical protein
MSVTIHDLRVTNGELNLVAELAAPADYKVLQALFRDCIKARFGKEVRFGLTTAGRNKAMLAYPCQVPMTLSYDDALGDTELGGVQVAFGGLGPR